MGQKTNSGNGSITLSIHELKFLMALLQELDEVGKAEVTESMGPIIRSMIREINQTLEHSG